MRPFLLRLIAGFLLLYGTVGIAASLWAARQASELFADARAVASAAPLTDAGSVVRSLSRTLGSAASSTASGTQSLGTAQRSLGAGSASASELAQAMSLLELAMGFDLFGSRPLNGVAGSIGESSRQLDRLAVALSETERSLETTRRDMAVLEGDLRDIQAQSARLADRLGQATGADALARTISTAEWLANVVLVGFALQSVLFLGIGGALLLLAAGTTGEMADRTARHDAA